MGEQFETAVIHVEGSLLYNHEEWIMNDLVINWLPVAACLYGLGLLIYVVAVSQSEWSGVELGAVGAVTLPSKQTTYRQVLGSPWGALLFHGCLLCGCFFYAG